jgi:hypothetical protein
MKKSLFVAGGVMIAALSTLAQTATQTQQPSSERTQQALKKLEDDPAYKSLSPSDQKSVRDWFIANRDAEGDLIIAPRGRDAQPTVALPVAPKQTAPDPGCKAPPAKKPSWLQQRLQKMIDDAQKQVTKSAAPVAKQAGDPNIAKLPSASDIAKAVTAPCPATPAKKN